MGQVGNLPQAAVFDLDAALNMCFGRSELLQDMVGYLFDEADSLLEQDRSALAAGDAEEAGRAAHRLKGSVAYLGAPPALDAIRRVELVAKSGELAAAPAAVEELHDQVERLKQALAPHRKGAAPE